MIVKESTKYKRIYKDTILKINKLRLILKPVSEYPYNYVEIDEIELIEVNDDHYKNL